MRRPSSASNLTSKGHLKLAAVRSRPAPKSSQAHPGVAPLSAVSHRNVSFQPLPRPLGAAPYHYDLEDAFPDIAKAIADSGKLCFHVVGDPGGVQDGDSGVTRGSENPSG